MSDNDCDDTSCEILVSPIPRVRRRPLAVRRQPVQRKVSFINSSKPNSARILALACGALEERGIAAAVLLNKQRASRLMDESLLARAVADEGLVVVGVND